MSILEQFGFNHMSYQLDSAQLSEFTVARIVEQQKGLLKIVGQQRDASGEWWAEISGRLYHEAKSAQDLPVVGDWVLASLGAKGDRLQIHQVLPRSSVLMRRAAGRAEEVQLLAANVDQIFIVSSLNQDLNLNRLDRYRALAEQTGVPAMLILSKADLISDPAELEARVATLRDIIPLQIVSGLVGTGLEGLSEAIAPGRTYVFIGSSGVGKSTLINSLIGEEKLATSSIRADDDKGRHTTSSRSLSLLAGGGLLLDTPGIRELGLWNPTSADLELSFDPLAKLAGSCRFRDCAHQGEPGCAVLAAIDRGEIEASRLASLQKLLREREYNERRQDRKKQEEQKQRTKAISRSMRRMRRDE